MVLTEVGRPSGGWEYSWESKSRPRGLRGQGREELLGGLREETFCKE